MQILYISYDGMTDPLGQSQVLSYLKPLTDYGHSFDLISFEKPKNYALHAGYIKNYINDRIQWYPLRYTKSPPVLSTFFDILKGIYLAKKILKKNKCQVIHCRGYIAAIIGLYFNKKHGVPFVFDMRGWWADEKKESGHWKGRIFDWIYRYFKNLEKSFFKYSKKTVSLTYVGKEKIVKTGLKSDEDVVVIPTCVNLDLFKAYNQATRIRVREDLRIPPESIVMVYSGSLGGNYCTHIILDIFLAFQRNNENVYLLVVTREGLVIHEAIKRKNIDLTKIRIVESLYKDISNYLVSGDIGLILYDQAFSVIGRSPTKLGEYWSAGLLTIAPSWAGDLKMLFTQYPGSGYLLNEFSEQEYTRAIEAINKNTITKTGLRNFAIDYFDLQKGVKAYHQLYCDL